MDSYLEVDSGRAIVSFFFIESVDVRINRILQVVDSHSISIVRKEIR